MNSIDPKPHLSAVVPFYNEANRINGLLDSLSRQDADFDWEVILADNGSKDGSRRVIKNFEKIIPHLRIIQADQIPGAGHARNEGVKHSLSELIAFCDDDDEIPENWVSSMKTGIEKHDFIACRIDEDKLNAPELRGVMHLNKTGLMSYGYLPYSLGGSLGIKKSIFTGVNGYDTSLKYSEDSELCFRLQLAGTKLHYWEETCLYYRLQTSVWKTCMQNYRWCRYSKAIAHNYNNFGHSQIRFRLRQVPPMLKYALAFTYRFQNKKKKLIYGRLIFQNLGFAMPLIKSAVHPIQLPESQINKDTLESLIGSQAKN
jgi:glycosyltransferase involved in cell wall biosynthesis